MTQPLPEFPCTLCEYPHNVEGLCGRCHNRLYAQLNDLLPLWGEAHGQLQPGRSGNGGRSNEMSIGVNVHALSFIQGADLLGFLNEWGKMIADERGLNHQDRIKGENLTKQIDRKVKTLQSHLPWLGRTDYIGDFAGELGEIQSQGEVAARKFFEKTTRIACPADRDDGLPCGTMLKVAKDQIMDYFTCRGCKTEWTALRLVAVALAMPGQKVQVDPEAVAHYTRMSLKNVHQFAKRHEIPLRHGKYDLGAFQRLRKIDNSLGESI